jgi:Glycosyl transferase family 2
MKVVMTLVVRNERDIIAQHLAYHLAAGVAFVVVTDHGSTDGTTEILDEYERRGVVRVLHEPDGPFAQREWVTRMARLAATEHGADWVINSDADEFWWPRGGSLDEVLGTIPRRYGLVQSFVRHFVPVAEDGRPFQERMTKRLAPQAPINDPRSPWRPFRKMVHRGHPEADVVEGSHSIGGTGLVPMRGWYPIEVLHFPIRTGAQLEQKGRVWASAEDKFYASDDVIAGPGAAYHALAYRDAEDGSSGAVFAALTDPAREPVAEGFLVEDVRLRDALGSLDAGASAVIFPRATPSDEAAFAVDAAVLGEADVVRVRRRLDELELEVQSLQARPSARAERMLRGLARRLRPGGQ